MMTLKKGDFLLSHKQKFIAEVIDIYVENEWIDVIFHYNDHCKRATIALHYLISNYRLLSLEETKNFLSNIEINQLFR